MLGHRGPLVDGTIHARTSRHTCRACSRQRVWWLGGQAFGAQSRIGERDEAPDVAGDRTSSVAPRRHWSSSRRSGRPPSIPSQPQGWRVFIPDPHHRVLGQSALDQAPTRSRVATTPTRGNRSNPDDYARTARIARSASPVSRRHNDLALPSTLSAAMPERFRSLHGPFFWLSRSRPKGRCIAGPGRARWVMPDGLADRLGARRRHGT